MRTSATCLFRIVSGAVAACALGTVAAAASPTANAAPCSASGLAITASGVLSAAGGYLDSHPDANNVLTAAGTQSPEDARSSVRGYFISHPGELLDLQNIARPLTELRNQCNVAVSPSQLATLFDTISS